DLDLVAAHVHFDPTRTTGPVTLLDDDRHALGDDASPRQIASERTRSAARCGILRNAHCRIEEPRMRRGRRIDWVERKDVAPLAMERAHERDEPLGVGPHALQGGAIAQWHHEMRNAGRDDPAHEPTD